MNKLDTTGTGSRIIVALDFPDPGQALRFVDGVQPEQCRLKVGKELFTRAGPGFVEQLVGRGFGVFLDLKFHDIPNTVAGACRAAADLGVWMINVHALGGPRMMHAAREAIDQSGHGPLLIGVTILTSHDQKELQAIGLPGTAEENVQRLARLARESGLDGVVCSPLEAGGLRRNIGADFKLVTPGIRPAQTARDDQKRIMTPADAILGGSDYLVIGRPVTQASDPVGVLMTINSEIAALNTPMT